MKGLYRFKNSRIWWFRFTQGGKRNAVSLKTDDEPTAIIKARAILAEGLFEPPRAQSIEALITQYLRVAQERSKKPLRPETAKRIGYILRSYAKGSQIESVSQITHGSILQWLADYRGDTKYTYTRALKTFVKYLVGAKLMRADLLDNLHIPERAATGRKNWLKIEEVTRVIRESKDLSLTFVLLAGFHAGLRKNEICNARVGWFDLEAGLVHVQNDPGSGFILKDRENRTVPLTTEFQKFLNYFLTGRNLNEFAVHPGKTKNVVGGYRWDFRKLFYNHMRRCGVVCSIHDTRRSFASNLVSHGVSIYKVARWLGDGVQVVERSYGHLAPADSDIDRLTAKVA
jgi:integrase